MKITASIIIPTLNEEGNLDELIKKINKILYEIPHEIIVVDGYSKDKTVDVAKKKKRWQRR